MPASPRLIQYYNQIRPRLEGFEASFFASNPVFIVSTPRSGSTLLFEQLALLDNIWTIGGESHEIFQQFSHLRFENQNLDSASLNEAHADAQTSLLFKASLFSLLKNNRNQLAINSNLNNFPASVFIEKTPRNSLNIPFIQAMFPQARFIYLYREPKQNVSSIIEAWNTGLKTGQFVTFQQLPGWDRINWCLLLPRNWRSMNDKSLAEIAYFQWRESNLEIIRNLSKQPADNWISLEYDAFLANPQESIKKLLKFCKIESRLDAITQTLDLSQSTVSKPNPNKWKKHESQMHKLLEPMKNDYQKILDFTQ